MTDDPVQQALLGQTTAPRTLSVPALKELRITLDLPPKALSPNARVHWSKKARAAREYRNWAWAESRLALSKAFRLAPRWVKADVRVVFYFATNRRRDMDNFQASLKNAMDGIADAGIVANDCGLVHWPPELRIDKARPRVEIEIRAYPQQEEGQ